VSKRGLPTGLQMRHDAHYVEELSQHRPAQLGRMIPLDKLDPNPEQPRVDFGDAVRTIGRDLLADREMQPHVQPGVELARAW